MHGDKTAQENKRPPWHTVHPGISWATDRILEDARSLDRIKKDVAVHLTKNPPFTNRQEIIDRFLAAFAQAAIVADSPVEDTSLDVEEENNEK